MEEFCHILTIIFLFIVKLLWDGLCCMKHSLNTVSPPRSVSVVFSWPLWSCVCLAVRGSSPPAVRRRPPGVGRPHRDPPMAGRCRPLERSATATSSECVCIQPSSRCRCLTVNASWHNPSRSLCPRVPNTDSVLLAALHTVTPCEFESDSGFDLLKTRVKLHAAHLHAETCVSLLKWRTGKRY